jgi:5'(3')-deoxyribonucleotidase
MDGVLADMFNHVADLHDVDHYNEMSKDQWEEFLRDTDAYHLFRTLPAFPTANALLEMVVELFGGYRILSSPLGYDREGSIAGKKDWLEQHITVPADGWIFDHDKFKYARQDDGTPNILIDDWKKNIVPWREHGGLGIKYQADEDDLETLRAELSEIRARLQ